MDNQPWLDRVRQQLVRQALPRSYVRRFLEELTDHLDDLKEENMEADPISRLGEPEKVADNAAVACRQHIFLGRHCWARFLVLGLCNILLILVLMFLLKGTPLGRTPLIGRAIGSLLLLVAFPIKVYKEASGQDGFSILEFVLLLFSNGLLYGLIVETLLNFQKRRSMAAFLVFGVSPVVSLVVLFSIFAPFVFLVLTGIGIRDGNRIDALPTDAVIFAMSLLTVIIPSVVATILYCRLAERIEIGRTWGFVSCVILAIVASAPCCWRIGPGDLWHFAACWAGLRRGLREGGWVLLAQHFFQFVVPFVIGWWFMRRKRGQSRLQLVA
jgi:hypothetical protein